MAQPMQSSATPKSQVAKLPYWVEPLFTVVALGGFLVYAIWEVLAHKNGTYHNYVSPFFPPALGGGAVFHLFMALFVFWVPFFFRASCYYYRKEYYRAFFWDPPGCAVPEKRQRRYTGETKLPFSLNNLHRYFWLLAVIVLLFLWKDTVQGFIFSNGFGVGLGSIILLVNTTLLTFYTFSCHAFRHLVGGRKDCFSCDGQGESSSYRLWKRVSSWNVFHGTWAWASLFSVWAADLYVRLLINGVIHDVRFF